MHTAGLPLGPKRAQEKAKSLGKYLGGEAGQKKAEANKVPAQKRFGQVEAITNPTLVKKPAKRRSMGWYFRTRLTKDEKEERRMKQTINRAERSEEEEQSH